MTQTAKPQSDIKLVARVAPQVTNPLVIRVAAMVGGELVHSGLVDPTRADRRRAYIDAVFQSLGGRAMAAAGVAERAALDQQILDVARRTIPPDLVRIWGEIAGATLPATPRPQKARAQEEVTVEDREGDGADEDFEDDSEDESADDLADMAGHDPGDDPGDTSGDVPGDRRAASAVPGAGAGAGAERGAEEQDDSDRPRRLRIARVVRPELFFTPWVSGVYIVRRMLTEDWDEPEPEPSLYLQWADGRREVRSLRRTLRLPGGRGLRMEPDSVPADSATPSGSGSRWTVNARQAWVEGRHTPAPLDVFRRVLALITEFVDFKPTTSGLLTPEGTAGTTGTTGTTGTAGAADSPIAATLALWTMLTYSYPAWNTVPYLSIAGPPESGKTTLLGVLARLCFQPTPLTSLSKGLLLHALTQRPGTFLLDVGEALQQGGAQQSREIHNMLLGGYKRGARVTGVNAEGKQEGIDIFGPKALVCAGGLAPALARRCIPIRLSPAPLTSACPGRMIDPDDPRWAALTGDLHALALAHGQTWLSLARRTDILPQMGWRQQELWQPLLAMAAWLDENGATGLLEMMAAHAQSCCAMADQELVPDVGEVLLRALARRVEAGEEPTCAELLREAKEDEPAVARVLRGSPRAVAVALGRYGLWSTRGRVRRSFRLGMEDMRRVQEVYGIDLEICVTPQEVCVTS